MNVELRNRAGEIVATALIDDADAHILDGAPWRYHRATGYVRRSDVYLHRAICGLTRGDGLVVDHVNGDPLDNRRQNLRVCQHHENHQNRHGARGSSAHRGVYWNRTEQRWIAKVMVAGRSHTVGRYPTEALAAQAASDFRATHMPFSADARRAPKVEMRDQQEVVAG